MNNLRQLGLAFLSYANDNNNWFPTPPVDELPIAYPDKAACPLYNYNEQFGGASELTVTFIWRRLSPYLGNNGRVLYCPSVKGSVNNYDFSYEHLFGVVTNNSSWGLEVIHYTGNPYYQADRQGRGAFLHLWGVNPYDAWAPGAPNGAVLFDSYCYWGGGLYWLFNHQKNGAEVGKNVLFKDGSVCWYTRQNWPGYDGPWPVD
jgi:hypothetical protein